MMPALRVLALLAAAAAPSPVAAQDFVLGLFQNRYSTEGVPSTAALGLEYRPAPFAQLGRVKFRLALGLALDDRGNAWAGAGPSADWPLGPRWFVDLSVMPGLYRSAEEQFDLGNAGEFRTTLSLGFRLNNRSAIALALRHISNADLGETNPGLNGIGLRFYTRL
jgi:lipid A 3-O-deacylase